MKTFHKTTGTVIYDPKRHGMTHRVNWWCVVNIDDEIARYYRWWLKFEKHIHLQPPSWGAHVSVVRGEKPRPEFAPMWKSHHRNKITLEYCHGDIREYNSNRSDPRAKFVENDKYYVLEVKSPELLDIRAELGLRTDVTFHLTIGKIHEYEPRQRKR